MKIDIINLTKKFGAQTALNSINISSEGHEIIGLLGPNGAGKSTLMKSIVGAIKVDEGQILFDGKDITLDEINTKKKIGFLPEDNPLYRDMYVKEYLNFVAELHQISKDKIDEVIESVGTRIINFR
jgi:ABC-2 type transport system ATP-binding protein